MKLINTSNIVLQFDLEDDIVPTKDVVQSQIEIINALISEHCSWSQPQFKLTENSKLKIIELL